MYQYGEADNNKNKLTLEGDSFSINEKENNLIKNGTFSNGLSNWVATNCDSNDKVENEIFRIVGNSNVDKNIEQEVNVSGKKGDAFTLACWVNSKAVQNDSDTGRKMSLSMHILRKDGSRQVIDSNINVDGSGWQFKSDVAIADSDYSKVYVYLVCTNNENETFFDNVGLFKEEYGQSYVYDSNGNVISSSDNAKNEQSFEYNSNNKLISSINPMGGKFEYQYDINNPNKLISATNSLGNTYKFDYDNKGNITSMKVEESKNDEQDINVKYKTHLQELGWLDTVSNGATSGRTDLEYRMEALTVELEGAPSNAHIEYQAHVQDYGWMDWVTDGNIVGTVGEGKRVEAIQIRLLNLPNYSIKYRAYVEGIGWQDWVQNGEMAGTLYQAKKIYAVQIKIQSNIQSTKYYQEQAEYSSNGNYQTKIINQSGNSTQYQYNENTGTVSKITDAKNTSTNYSYDNLDKLTKVTKQASGKSYVNEYSYNNDLLQTVTHNKTKYMFTYDEFGNVKQTKVGNQVLITNNYEANNGKLSNVEYGNNQTVSYDYDRFNRIVKKTGTNGNYQYAYDAKSNLKSVTDGINNNTQEFTYDLANRLVKQTNTNGFTGEYEYDVNSNISANTYKFSNKNNKVKYNYDNANRLNSIKLNDNITWTNVFDGLSRISFKQISNGSNNYRIRYTYQNVANVNNKTTTMLAIIKNGINPSISYIYDELGNIETIKKGTTLTNQYYYDEINQLIKEIDVEQNKVITYEYDEGGNITRKKEYSYINGTQGTTPTKTITYTYGNTNWKDQLTSYNGKQITYDEIGNPLTYNGNTYTWQNGRQLAKISNNSQTITYKYNDNGIRTQKTVNGVTTNYYVEGNKVIYEKTGNNITYYTYDENGNIIGLNYNGTQYYYIKNGQNDIIGILDSSLNQIVSYEYDSWGKLLSIKDANENNITSSTNIGIINPYRYRGYRYDTETELYYLNSRYYNPEWGRFINFDNYGGQIGEISSHNGYAYCTNNPVNMMDANGNEALALTWIAYNTISILPEIISGGMTIGTILDGMNTIVQERVQEVSSIANAATIAQTLTKVKMNERNQQNVYWPAELYGRKVHVDKANPLSMEQAKQRIKMHQSVMALNDIEARALANQTSPTHYILERPHKSNNEYYWHYHPYENHEGVHIWFYGVPLN